MSHKNLLNVVAPVVVFGLLLSLAGLEYMNRRQTNLDAGLSRDIASLQAAQELKSRALQLKCRDLLYLVDQESIDRRAVAANQRELEKALDAARQASQTDRERALVQTIGDEELPELWADSAPGGTLADIRKRIDAHQIDRDDDDCDELVRVNKDQMESAEEERLQFGRQANWATPLLGLAGLIGGLALGYCAARTMSPVGDDSGQGW